MLDRLHKASYICLILIVYLELYIIYTFSRTFEPLRIVSNTRQEKLFCEKNWCCFTYLHKLQRKLKRSTDWVCSKVMLPVCSNVLVNSMCFVKEMLDQFAVKNICSVNNGLRLYLLHYFVARSPYPLNSVLFVWSMLDRVVYILKVLIACPFNIPVTR